VLISTDQGHTWQAGSAALLEDVELGAPVSSTTAGVVALGAKYPEESVDVVVHVSAHRSRNALARPPPIPLVSTPARPARISLARRPSDRVAAHPACGHRLLSRGEARRTQTVATVVVALVSLCVFTTGCGDACNAEGFTSAATIDAIAFASAYPTEVLTACLDQVCKELGGAGRDAVRGVAVLGLNASAHERWQLTIRGQRDTHLDREVRLPRHRPNGRGCDPLVIRARVAISRSGAVVISEDAS